MTLTQCKKLFSDHFGIPATAANAKQSVKGDFRCKQAWILVIEHLANS